VLAFVQSGATFEVRRKAARDRHPHRRERHPATWCNRPKPADRDRPETACCVAAHEAPSARSSPSWWPAARTSISPYRAPRRRTPNL